MRDIINLHHAGVGKVEFQFFPDFKGAQPGNFLWLEEERTSPYEDPFRDAIIFINDKFKNSKNMRRLVAAKELMHVFDDPSQQVNSPDLFRQLLTEIASNPMIEDLSPQYQADRAALWKAILALIPPWIREQHHANWQAKQIRTADLSRILMLPHSIVDAAMGPHYDRYVDRWLK